MGGSLTVLIGPPAAGKSTWRQNFKGEVISTDAIRREKFGVQYDPRIEPAVWRLAYVKLRQALAEGKDVCFDATNTTRARRQPLIRLAKEYGATVRAVVFLHDLELLLRRNAARPPGKRVPDEVILTKYEEFQMPTYEEGFDSIEVIEGT
ncbi:MAG: hypothetical protein PWP65_679 [Clostridia bacterium]|nr:hypothetical protein [Clostridia bacterium]